jgi:hypothetical protein
MLRRVLTMLLGLAVAGAPGGRFEPTNPVYRTPEVVYFEGTQAKVILRGDKERLRLRDELLDLELTGGTHFISEPEARQSPGPLMLVSCSKHNRVDGQAVVVGAAGVKLKGPRLLSVFAVEPFPSRFPGARLRTLRDNGAGLFSAETVDVVQVPEDYRYLRIVGLDPTAKYEVKVLGTSVEQVLVVADRELADGEGERPADADWSASRLILSQGGSAVLPPTRQLALTLIGVDALMHGQAIGARVPVEVNRVQPGTGDLGPKRTITIGDNGKRFTLTVANQLLLQGDVDGARALVEQCVALDSRNAECHLVYARVWGAEGDLRTAVSEACEALRLGEGTPIADEAKQLLGDPHRRCR